MRATLLGGESVAYSRIGASGILFAQLIERMGIAAEINARATIIPSGFTAERLVSGEADLAVQQISELKLVAWHRGGRTDPAGTANAGGVFRRPAGGIEQRRASDRLLKYLASPEAAPALRESGLEP